MIPTVYDQLYDAVEHDDTPEVRRLVEQISEVPECVLCAAVKYKRVEHIDILAPKCNDFTISQAFYSAIGFSERINMVEALLPYTHQNLRNQALVSACGQQNTEAVELLYPLCDIPDVLRKLEHYKGWFIDVWKATFHERLNKDNIGTNNVGTMGPAASIKVDGAQCEDPNSIHFITPQIMDDVRLGNVAGVQQFLSSKPLQSDIQKMVEVAAVNGRSHCLKLLLLCSKTTHDHALILASRKGHAQCVALLIPVSNPRSHKSCALSLAVLSGHHHCIDLLLPVSDPHMALHTIRHDFCDPQLYEVLEHAITHHQKRILEESLGDTVNPCGFRKV